MIVKSTEMGVAVYLTPDGAIIHDNVEALERSVREADVEGHPHMVVDLRHVPYIDSRGLEFLVDLSAGLRETGGSLLLANASPLCKEILAITGADQGIPVHDDLESAGRSFL